MSVAHHAPAFEEKSLERDFEAVRERTLSLVEGLSDEQLHQPLGPVMSPLVWDLGHIAAYEELWLVHRHGQRPLLRSDLHHPLSVGEHRSA